MCKGLNAKIIYHKAGLIPEDTEVKRHSLEIIVSVSLHLPLSSKIKIDDVHDAGVQWHPILHSLLV